MAESYLADDDGYWCAGHNFYNYFAPDGRLHWLAHDLDAVAYRDVPATSPPLICNSPRLTNPIPLHYFAFLNATFGKSGLLAALRNIVRAADPTVYQNRLSTWDAQIRQRLIDDPNRDDDISVHDNQVAFMKNVFSARHSYLQQWLENTMVVSPTYDLGFVNPGDTSNFKYLPFSNSADSRSPLTVTSTTITGPDASAFLVLEQSPGLGVRIQSGNTGNLALIFSPSQARITLRLLRFITIILLTTQRR